MRRQRLWLGMLMVAGLASGCGPRTGSVSGQVLFDGKPLPGGVLTFLPTEPGGYPVSAVLDADGRYALSMPAGEYRLAVDNRELEARNRKAPPPATPPGVKLPPQAKSDAPPREKAPAMPGQYVRIPDKYASGTTSGLTATVTGGTQTHDVKLAK